MDLFTQIKMGVSVKEAAEYYGLEVNRGNMVCCPFHAEIGRASCRERV